MIRPAPILSALDISTTPVCRSAKAAISPTVSLLGRDAPGRGSSNPLAVTRSMHGGAIGFTLIDAPQAERVMESGSDSRSMIARALCVVYLDIVVPRHLVDAVDRLGVLDDDPDTLLTRLGHSIRHLGLHDVGGVLLPRGVAGEEELPDDEPDEAEGEETSDRGDRNPSPARLGQHLSQSLTELRHSEPVLSAPRP